MNLLRTFAVMIYVLLASISTINIVRAEEGNSYGPVKQGDSLWAIASKVRPPSVGPYQAILALHKANPHAFTTPCNMSSLKVGDLLRIPSLSEMQVVTETKAFKEVNRQIEEWKNRRQIPIVCPQVPSPEPPEEQIESLTTEIADNTAPSLIEPTNEVGKSETEAEVDQLTVLSTTASDTLKLSATNTDDSDSPPQHEQEQPAALSDNIVQTTNAGVDEKTQTFDIFEMIESYSIVLFVIGGIFIIFIIYWIIGSLKQAKRKANDNFPKDDIEERSYTKQAKASVSDKKTD